MKKKGNHQMNAFETRRACIIVQILLLTFPLGAQDSAGNDADRGNTSASDMKFERYRVEYLNDAKPIISESDFEALGAPDSQGNNINGPSVLRIPEWLPSEKRADPKAEYYCYFGHHGGQYIRLAWAEKIDGPWNLYRVGSDVPKGTRGVLDLENKSNGWIDGTWHIASPDIHVDNKRRRFVMYFHGHFNGRKKGWELNQATQVALSDDGLDFNGGVQDAVLGRSYFRVFTVHGRTYAFANGCYLLSAPEGAGPTDERAWTATPDHFRQKQVLWKEQPDFFKKFEKATGFRMHGAKPMRHPAVLQIDANHILLFYSKRFIDPPERIEALQIHTPTADWRTWKVSKPHTIHRPTKPWEGVDYPIKPSRGSTGTHVHQLRDPYVLHDHGRLVLFYCASGEEALGLVELLTPASKLSGKMNHGN